MMTKMNRTRADTCIKCGGPLDFAGFDTSRRRVSICLNSLSVRRNDGTYDSMLCNSTGEYIIGGARFKTVNWLRKD